MASLATCLCENYLKCVNMFLFLLGLLGMVFMIWALVAGSSSVSSFKEFAELAKTSKALWGSIIGGLLIIIASCLGLAFATNKERCLGCSYLCVTLIAIILQAAMVVFVIGGDIAAVNGLRHSVLDDEQAKDFQQKREDHLKDALGKALVSWLDSFNNPEKPDTSKRCTFKDGAIPIPSVPHWLNPFSGSGGDSAALAALAEGADLDEEEEEEEEEKEEEDNEKKDNEKEKEPEEDLAEPALAAADLPGLEATVRRLNLVEDGLKWAAGKKICVPEKREVNCERDEDHGVVITENCMAAVSTKTGKEEFTNTCAGCYIRFWESVEVDKQFPDSAEGKLNSLRYRKLFLGGGGQSFCRCLGGFLGLIKAHFPKICGVAIAFLVLEALVLMSTIYLMVCGPEQQEKRAISRPSFSGDVELANRRRSSSGLVVETVECPEGCKPGDPIMVTTQAGQNVQVIVPDGVWPGMMFNVEIPV